VVCPKNENHQPWLTVPGKFKPRKWSRSWPIMVGVFPHNEEAFCDTPNILDRKYLVILWLLWQLMKKENTFEFNLCLMWSKLDWFCPSQILFLIYWLWNGASIESSLSAALGSCKVISSPHTHLWCFRRPWQRGWSGHNMESYLVIVTVYNITTETIILNHEAVCLQ